MGSVPKQPQKTPFSVFLWGGVERFQRRADILKVFTNTPVFSKETFTPSSLARKDVWSRAVLQARELIAIKYKEGWSNAQFLESIRMLDDSLPVLPQFRIFLSNLERQMSDEQKAIWVPKAERFEIFGCYAQTELGHGSNVRGIETTATFDETTDDFVINSPTLSSTKYWIGAAGIWATHAIVVARLVVKTEDLGNHLFLTQLRNLDTQEPMPGVEVYELGPKAFQGMLGVDNGAIQFHNVRIPRSQMLARHARVNRDGTYIAATNVHHSYGSMVTVHALMAEITGLDLLKAVSVAYYYTNFRKQFKRKGSNEETVVFDYASVKNRLLPLLAQGTVLVLVGRTIKDAYDKYTNNLLNTGDTSRLEDLHIQTVGAKVYSTEITSRGIETCRIMCGGHGYSALSGFGRKYANAVSAVTYEGDNYVIAQQVPRAILKHYNAKSATIVPSLSYLSLLRNPAATGLLNVDRQRDWFNTDNQKWVLEHRLVVLVKRHMDDTIRGIDTSFTVHALTMAHCDFVYWNGLQELIADASPLFKEELESLAHVFSLHILNDAHKDLCDLQISEVQRESLRAAVTSAIEAFTSLVKVFIQGFAFTEYELDSALARSDMNPYEALFQGAQKSEMNHMPHLRPLIVSARSIWKNLESAKL